MDQLAERAVQVATVPGASTAHQWAATCPGPAGNGSRMTADAPEGRAVLELWIVSRDVSDASGN